ncbi:MAG: choice-of-anchor K domain-containing protein [Myxococcales bacterium]|nr:choice-of-anchor K domain-containing protein [Myxococcales bacterium]
MARRHFAQSAHSKAVKRIRILEPTRRRRKPCAPETIRGNTLHRQCPAPAPDPDPDPDPDPTPIDPRTILPSPTLSLPGGYYPKTDFDLSVTIGNAPDPSIGKIIYSIDNKGWNDYAGETLRIKRDNELRAQAIALDTANYRNSGVTYGFYTIPTPPTLPTPIFNLYGGGYPRQSFPLALSLNNRPDASIANALYRLDKGAWLPYSGPFSVAKNTQVEAQYDSLDKDIYRSSSIRKEYYYPVATDLDGNVTASFHDAKGGKELMAEVTDGGTFFSHGNPQMNLGGEIIDAGEPNTLRIEPHHFSNITHGQSFKLADLYYHNGTTFNDSHATAVQLEMTIALANPNQNITFNLKFDLVNTENSADPNASADCVRLTNLTQNIGLVIDDVNYTLQLQFGGTDSFGFSSFDEFHVYEGATGRGAINATFITRP